MLQFVNPIGPLLQGTINGSKGATSTVKGLKGFVKYKAKGIANALGSIRNKGRAKKRINKIWRYNDQPYVYRKVYK